MKAIVIIPEYKEKLSVNENISLEQGEKVLSNYDICFIAPERMRQCDYIKRHRTVFFDDDFFRSTATYSSLLLSVDFYQLFLDYDYMLIYQNDAFVFSDMLDEWCKKGYDYIGAPDAGMDNFYTEVGNCVGNGGFSLRNISSCIRVLKVKEKVFQNHPVGWKMREAEDLYFAYCGTVPEMNFKTPAVEEAVRFSVQVNLCNAFSLHEYQLPFGTHYWDKVEYSHWKPYIESFGYKTVPPEHETISEDSAKRYAENTFTNKYLNGTWHQDFAEKLKEWITSFPKKGDKVAIRGSGLIGNRVAAFLDKSGICYFFIDRYSDGQVVKKPSAEFYTNNECLIIIASTKYEDEMCHEVEEYGYIYNNDYVTYGDLFDLIYTSYPNTMEMLRKKFLHIS